MHEIRGALVVQLTNRGAKASGYVVVSSQTADDLFEPLQPSDGDLRRPQQMIEILPARLTRRVIE